MKSELSDKISQYSSYLNELRRVDILRIKEENRRLSEIIDELTLELLELRAAVRDKENGRPKSKNKKGPSEKVSSNNIVDFPVILTENVKFYSRVLYPTKKLAYYYAVLGVKNTIKIIVSHIRRRFI